MEEQAPDGVGQSILPERVRVLVERINDVPALPAAVTAVARMTSDSKVTARQIADVISHDQALTSRLLRIVNSPFYGFSREIWTVDHAIVIMGMNALRAAVLGASVFDSLSLQAHRQEYQAFQEHSAFVAEATRRLAATYGMRETGEAQVAGLLHDVGKLLIEMHFPEQAEAVRQFVATSGLPSLVGERKILGATHAELGGWLAERWKLPEALRDAITFHHDPSAAEERPLETALVHLADIVTHRMERLRGAKTPAPPINRAAWAFLAEIRPDIEKDEVDVFANNLLDCADSVAEYAAGLLR